tara:strand:+ start:46 stop:210 length:165 start_codon:yes stop_codon:yes gene_type:complete
MKSLEGKIAIITVTQTYEYPLCDCCCDHPDDVLNFDYTFYKKSEKTEVTIEGEE